MIAPGSVRFLVPHDELFRPHSHAPVIRRAVARDAPEIARILELAFAPFEIQYTPAAYRATVLTPAEIVARLDEGPVWVALLNDGPAATVSALLTAEGVYVRSMAAAPQARGRGLGRSLLDAIELFARDSGAGRLYLSTTPFLHAAIRLYERAGFRRSGAGPDHLHGTPLFTMERPCPHPEDTP